ncbi:ATP-binding cassette domain-containing protein [[Clostridium] innocuum]|uniref:ABC transporter ATP-binding protein n=1 Tax=Clostridium innocuum TaxID=1522 RepID=UPI001C234825|nr:ATP-binding cassette domain-containing protein [[Clostridium] innocuum]MBU9108554.1 ATP-binding cassette domain-containing protein [[Clostridium] innocuum]
MLELRNVSFEVDGKKILNNISLTMEDNRFTVITGPNGGGKSTLAKLIMGIEKPTEGEILFDGEDITAMSIDERAKRKIGYAFQQPPRFKGMSVRKLLSLAHGKDLDEEICCSYLTDVGLCSKDYLNRDVDASLSGGEVKRIEIASILARDLKLSIFDEPEAGIDLWSFAKLVETFQKLQRESRQSIILISHQERIMQLADEIIIIENGAIKTKGKRDDILPSLMSEFDFCEFKK